MRRLLAAAVLFVAAGPRAFAQDADDAFAERGPRFLAALSPAPVRADIARMPTLRQRISIDLSGLPLAEALRVVSEKSGVYLAFSNALLPERTVQLRAENITVAAALTELLLDAQVDILFSRDGRGVLVRRQVGVARAGSLVGRVRDAKTGQPIAAVDLWLERTRWRATTDTAGRYRFAEVDTGTYTLMARRLGYAKQRRQATVREGGTDTLDVALEPVAARLDELVTTATGRQRRMDIANDITTINADSVMRVAPIRSVTDLLDTRVPGLTVQRTSGSPGDPARLRLRGLSSPLRSNDPIVIVDGIRVYAEQSAKRSGNLARFGAGPQDTVVALTGYVSAAPSPLDYINPNSIETIEVFKGPSAATLYGQDAANGVIVITTKKGKAGPTRWTASAEHGRTQLAGAYPELFFRWGHPILENIPVPCPVGRQVVTGGGGLYRSEVPCTGDSLLTFQLLNDPHLTVLDRGRRTALSLGMSGGNAALIYAVTGSYGDESGLLKLPEYEADRYQAELGQAAPDWMRRPQHFKQWGVTSTVTARLGAKGEVSLRASLSRNEQRKSSLQDQLGDLMSTYLDRTSGIYYRKTLTGSTYNVVGVPISGYYERALARGTKFTNGVNVSYRPKTWLTLRGDAGLDVLQRADELFFPRGPAVERDQFGNATDSTGYVNNGHGTSVLSTVNLQASARRPLGRGFQVRVALGANYAGTSIRDQSVGTRHLPVGSTLRGDDVDFYIPSETSDATFGWYAEPSIGNSKFNFTSGLRLDGGSSYGGGMSGLSLPKFPKLGFSYLVSDESWFPLKNLVSSLRLRISYGKAGRQPGIGDKLRLYGTPSNVLVDNQVVPGVNLQTLGNTELRPERSAEVEGGFDADLLDSRLTLSVTGYRKKTEDAILPFPVATSVYGDQNILKNIGVTRNTGLELDLAVQVVRRGPVSWTTNLLLSRRRDDVVSLGPNVVPYYATGTPTAGGTRVVARYPLFGRWSRPILGYADANGDGVLQATEVQLGDTAVYVGSPLPDYTAGFSTTLTLWRALTVNAGFQYEDGLAQRNEVARQLSVFARGQQDPASSLAEQAATIDLAGDAVRVNRKTDYNWIQTVNTMRFNSLGVSYAVPVGIARRLGAQTLTITVQGANLGLWTNYRGLDPNVNAFGTGNSVTDTGVLPQPRTWQLRVGATY